MRSAEHPEQPEKDRRPLLESMERPIQVVALALLVAEASYGLMIFRLDGENQLAAFGLFGGMVAVTLLTLYGIERARTAAITIGGRRIISREIPTREALYRELARAVTGASYILDTTWGRATRRLTAPEGVAKELYRKAIDDAVTQGKEYRELLNSLDVESEFFREAGARMEKHPNYEARAVEADLTELSILDFAVFDGRRVIFSHIDARNMKPSFLFVESRALAGMFERLHSECWSAAKSLDDVTAKHLAAKLKSKEATG